MPKHIIALDIDDVLSESTDALRQFTNRRIGTSLTKEHFSVPGTYHTYYTDILARHNVNGISPADYHDEVAIDQSHISIMPGAKEALATLSDRYDFVFITAREEDLGPATRRWIDERLGLTESEIHHVKVFQNAKAETKGQIAKRIGASYLIDDYYPHCLAAIDEGIEAILFGEYGWQHDAPDHLVRAKDWTAVLEYFDGR